jgi:hypothetical protein
MLLRVERRRQGAKQTDARQPANSVLFVDLLDPCQGSASGCSRTLGRVTMRSTCEYWTVADP